MEDREPLRSFDTAAKAACEDQVRGDVAAENVAVGSVTFDVGRHDPVGQRLDESHVELSAGTTRVMPVVCRYAWPSELDLMARIAGLRLLERWGGWEREPSTADSRNCVSVYGR